MQTEQKNPEHAVPEFQACRKPIGFTISIGVTAWSCHPKELAVLMNRSDGPLSRAKGDGRSRVCTARHRAFAGEQVIRSRNGV